MTELVIIHNPVRVYIEEGNLFSADSCVIECALCLVGKALHITFTPPDYLTEPHGYPVVRLTVPSDWQGEVWLNSRSLVLGNGTGCTVKDNPHNEHTAYEFS